MIFLQDQLNIAGLVGVWEKILPHLKYSIKLRPKNSKIQKHISKIGGNPDGTVPFEFPMNAEEEHLSFIAQINLQEIQAFDYEGLLPDQGMLYFFYDAFYQPSGYENEHQRGWRVTYDPTPIIPSKMIKIPLHPELEARNNEMGSIFEKLIFSEFEVDFYTEYSLPPYESEFIRSLNLDFDNLWKYEQLYFEQVNQRPRYRMLGFPDRKKVNTDMVSICRIAANYIDHNPFGFDDGYLPPKQLNTEKEEWILLLQIDSDLEVGMAWGGEEMGRIYFWIRKQDLLQRNFDRCWVILEEG